MKTLNIGDISINKVLDGEERFPAVNAFPDIDICLLYTSDAADE